MRSFVHKWNLGQPHSNPVGLVTWKENESRDEGQDA